ncbi:glycosyltransferase [Leptospira biflexa]|uniref:glycosyltransferase family 2 protein n=1 Tax=Leptospira biflexa TaxID=172 RepID=UPI0010911AB5|nr:glycosyltransferase family 2 protein [Leptospira biflexa]TGM45234.1 glycosyltransferase [Leptospira biflexa]TGM54007.1 glycosyltransferase [Leptospira biflexa]
MSQISKNQIVSIVTPSYNQGEFIDRTISSILSQEGSFYLDLIVMDGGSKDDSVARIRYYADLLQNAEKSGIYQDLIFRKLTGDTAFLTNCLGISYRWFSEKDNGQTHAINKGWKLANGSIIAWLNSDDIYLPSAINKAFTALIENDSLALYGVGLHIDKEDRFLEFYPVESFSKERLIDYCIICQPTVFLKSEVLNKVGYLNESLGYCMDYEYWLRISQANSFIFLPEVLACTRIHENTKTSQNLNVHREIVQMQKSVVGKTSDHWLFHYSQYLMKDRFPKMKHSFLLKLVVRFYYYYLKYFL